MMPGNERRAAVSGRLHCDTIRASDDAGSRHAHKETMLNNADSVDELLTSGHRVLDPLLELEVHDVVPVVGNGNLVAIDLVVRHISNPELRLATSQGWELSDLSHSMLMAEWDDLNVDWESGSQPIAERRPC